MSFPSTSALRVFDAAARLGSFKAAAAELGVTPTAVSHQIRNLEDQIGVALFVRGTRKVDLTAAGQTLLEATGPAFRRIGAALEEIGSARQTLTLTTTPAFAALWLIPKIRAFEAAHAGIQVHVDTSVHPVDIARDRRIDLAIRYGGGVSETSKALVHERMGAFAAPGFCERVDDLNKACLLETAWRSDTLPQISWEDWFAARGQPCSEPMDLRRFDEEQQVINAALAGQGIALVSTLLVADLVIRGWLVPISPETFLPGLSYFLIVPADKADTRKVQMFLTWLRGEIAVTEAAGCGNETA